MSTRERAGEARGKFLPHDVRILTHEQAQVFYNRMGAKQDWQAFYEAKATHDLIAHASFETAQAVFEFGCGTAAFAERLLAVYLSPEAQYVAVDSSPTMIRLAQERLARFGSRVEVQLTDGSVQFDNPSGVYDRFVSTYVADLLSAADIAEMLSEAHRILKMEVLLLLSLASLLSLLHTFATTRAAPVMLSIKDTPDDEAILTAKLDRFARWHTVQAMFQVVAFFVLLWALAIM